MLYYYYLCISVLLSYFYYAYIQSNSLFFHILPLQQQHKYNNASSYLMSYSLSQQQSQTTLNILQYFQRNKNTKQTICSLCGWTATVSKLDTTPLIQHFNQFHLAILSGQSSLPIANPGNVRNLTSKSKGINNRNYDRNYENQVSSLAYGSYNQGYAGQMNQNYHLPRQYQDYNPIYNDFQQEPSSNFPSEPAEAAYPYGHQNEYSSMYQQSYVDSNIQPQSQINVYNTGFGKNSKPSGLDKILERGVERGQKKKRGRRTKKEMMEIRERQARQSRQRAGHLGAPTIINRNIHSNYGNNISYYEQQPYPVNNYNPYQQTDFPEQQAEYPDQYANYNNNEYYPQYENQHPPININTNMVRYQDTPLQQQDQQQERLLEQEPSQQDDIQLQNLQQGEGYSKYMGGQGKPENKQFLVQQHEGIEQYEQYGYGGYGQELEQQEQQLEQQVDINGNSKPDDNDQILGFVNQNLQQNSQQNVSQAFKSSTKNIEKQQKKMNQNNNARTVFANSKPDFISDRPIKPSVNDQIRQKYIGNAQSKQHNSFQNKTQPSRQKTQLSKPNLPTPAYSTYQNIKNRPRLLLQKIQLDEYYTATPSTPSLYSNLSKYPLTLPLSVPPHVAKQFFRSVDFGLNKESVLLMAKNKLGTGEQETKVVVDEMWWGYKGMNQIGAIFRQRGYAFKQSEGRTTIMICQKNIIDEYLRYGECLYILTYPNHVPIPVPSSSSMQSFSTHIILCADWRSEYIFIGTAFTKTNGRANIVQMLEMLYSCMSGFVNNTIVIVLMKNPQNNVGNRQDKINQSFIQGEDYESVYCRQFGQAINAVNSRYGSKIELNVNLAVNQDTFQKNMQKMKEQKLKEKLIKEQIEREINLFNQELQSKLEENKKKTISEINIDDEADNLNDYKQKQHSQTYVEIPEELQSLSFRVVKSNALSTNPMECYNPNSLFFPVSHTCNHHYFTGLTSKISQCESLRRKMYWISKPCSKSIKTTENSYNQNNGEQSIIDIDIYNQASNNNYINSKKKYEKQKQMLKCSGESVSREDNRQGEKNSNGQADVNGRHGLAEFCQFVSAVFRFARYLRKIGKQVGFDIKHDYVRYKHQFMYKLYAKYSPKIFHQLRKAYNKSLHLTHKPLSPTSISITEQLQQPSSTTTNLISYSTHTIIYSLAHNHWVCNCNKIYLTGIPCKHLIYVIMLYGGSVDYYVNQRWVGWKGDRDKLRGLRWKRKGE